MPSRWNFSCAKVRSASASASSCSALTTSFFRAIFFLEQGLLALQVSLRELGRPFAFAILGPRLPSSGCQTRQRLTGLHRVPWMRLFSQARPEVRALIFAKRSPFSSIAASPRWGRKRLQQSHADFDTYVFCASSTGEQLLFPRVSPSLFRLPCDLLPLCAASFDCSSPCSFVTVIIE